MLMVREIEGTGESELLVSTTATSRAILTVFLVISFLSRRMGAPLEPKPMPPNREIQSTLEVKQLSWLLTLVNRLETEAW